MAGRMAGRVAVMAVMLKLLAIVGRLHVVEGAVYNVGDSAGWTTIGNVDYKKWAATKTFALSDVIVFKYNPKFHNVMQVNHEAYRACNASLPIATHTTGNDSIVVTRHGHYFFICGIPGHCQSGQKVDIRVPRNTTAASPSISPSPSLLEPSSSPDATPMSPNPSPSPSPSTAAALTLAPLKQGLLTLAPPALLTFFVMFAT